jgi:hypothetical protein
VSYQQSPDRQADAAGPPPGWYPDPRGLQIVRWWDGTQWTPHEQPLPGIRQETQPLYQGATAPAAGGYAAHREQSAGQQRYGQQPHQPSFTPHAEPYDQRSYQPQGQPQYQTQPHGQEWRASHFPDCGSFRILDRKGRENGGEVQDIFT